VSDLKGDVNVWSQAGWRKHLGWDPSPRQLGQFQALYQAVLAGNQSQNLTRITDPTDFWEKHLWDSLRPLQSFAAVDARGFEVALSVMDIGSGAGFPGIPVAIFAPAWRVSLLDATQRRMHFAQQTASALGLTVATIAERAEIVGRQHRDHYDLALNRALGSAAVCAELSLPLLKLGGYALLYRGHWDLEQERALALACQKLGAEIKATDPFVTPISQGIRHAIVLQKLAPTPAIYPRSIGIPAKRPLG
jgi:16S rRNA (guanine527-N7)-methyltransferase